MAQNHKVPRGSPIDKKKKKKIDSSEAGASKIWSKAFVPNGVKTSPQVPGLKWSENISMSPWTIRGNNNKKEIFF